MVVVKFCGGLGNQLFQYALGCALEAVGNEVAYDTSWYSADSTRQYCLHHFNVHVHWAVPRGELYHEPSLCYLPGLVTRYLRDRTLEGFWQCEKYFLPVRSRLLEELTLRRFLSGRSQKFADEILETPGAISLHIRRTDNLRPDALARHGYLDPASGYYGSAARFIDATLEEYPHFFIFSDDIAWCRENVKVHERTIVDANTAGCVEIGNHDVRAVEGTQHEDLWLMHLCQHHILANSTFGWWAAWLCQNRNKIVVAPKQWFVGQHNELSRDIIPAEWKRF